MKKIYCFKTYIGNITVAEEEGKINNLYFNDEISIAKGIFEETSLLREAEKQINEYFNFKRKEFDLPLKLYGTEFQLKVWNALINIPYGTTLSYGDVAKSIGNAKAYRAVGMACNRNPIAIIVPCHRVIGENGKLTGYAGGLYLKEQLLNIEK